MTDFEDRGDALTEKAPGVETIAVGGSDAGAAAERPDGVVAGLQRAHALLAGQIAQALSGALSDPAVGTPVRLAVTVPGLDPLAWLVGQAATRTGAPSLFWRDREGRERVAGLGVADRLALSAPEATGALIGQAQRRLDAAPEGVRYWGGFRFDMAAPQGAEWRGFGLGWLVLPRFEAVERGGETQFCCTVMPGATAPMRCWPNSRRSARCRRRRGPCRGRSAAPMPPMPRAGLRACGP